MEQHRQPPPQPLLFAACRLPPDASSAPAARALVREVLAGRIPAETVHTVELLACEVVTNAVVHARTPCRLRLTEPRRGTVRVEVSDESGSQARLTPAGSGDAAGSGRGLVLVDALSTAWGTTLGGSGKTIWLEVHERA